MTLLQTWVLVGVPAVVVALAMFVGRSAWRSLVGYLALLVGFAVLAARHPPSGALLGGILALLYAAGRGGSREREDDPAGDTGRRAAETAR